MKRMLAVEFAEFLLLDTTGRITLLFH
jgi:hypothetical protein